jgi:hypothetical protein
MRRIVLLTGVLALAAAPASAEPVGFFASLEGDVHVAKPVASGPLAWDAARQDGSIEIGDRVKTGLDSSAKLVLVDDTMLHVAEDTELEIQTFHVGNAATRERSIVRHTRGRLRTLVGDAFGGETRLEIHTPTAVVGVKGTDFETREDSLPGRTRYRYCLHSGAISVSNAMGSASPRPGHCIWVSEGRKPGASFANPDPPFEAPDSLKPSDDDFTEDVAFVPIEEGDPGKDEGDLRVFELPEAPPPPSTPINPAVFVAVP